MKMSDIRTLAELVEKHGLTALDYAEGEAHIRIERTPAPVTAAVPAVPAAPAAPAAAPAPAAASAPRAPWLVEALRGKKRGRAVWPAPPFCARMRPVSRVSQGFFRLSLAFFRETLYR